MVIDFMKRNWYLALLVLMAISLLSCQREDEVPTIAPVATVPISPTVTPIPATPTPGYLEPRHRGSVNFSAEHTIDVVNVSQDAGSSQNPAFIDVEITSMRPLSVTLEVSRIEDDGRVLLIDRRPITLQNSPAVSSSIIQPGIHEHLFIWDAYGAYLSDGSAGGFVFIEEIAPGLGLVRGIHKPAGTDEANDADLLFDLENNTLVSVSEPNLGEPLAVNSGDTFQTQIYYLEGVDSYTSETGTALYFGDFGNLYLQELPLPDGLYQLDYRFTSADGPRIDIFEQITVENTSLDPGQQNYFDPDHGYQFRVPDDWSSPSTSSGMVTAQDPSGSMTLSVTSQPVDAGTTSSELLDQVLEAYGNVQIFYEEPVSLGDINTSWTAYGYESDDGLITGVFLALVVDGWGHVFDLEGQASEEERLLETAGDFIGSLEMRPVGRQEHPGKWVDTQIDGYIVSMDGTFLHDQSDEALDKFVAKDGSSFIAFQSFEGGRIKTNDLRSYLLDEIIGLAPEIELSEQYGLDLGSNQWNRIDYSYKEPNGNPRWGFIARSADPEVKLLVWAETMPGSFDSMERDTFLPILADIRVNDEPESSNNDLN